MMYVSVALISAAIPAFAALTMPESEPRSTPGGREKIATVRVYSTCLNFRAQASSRSRVRGCLGAGSEVKILNYNPGGYSQVDINGRTGYLFTRYLSLPSGGPQVTVPAQTIREYSNNPANSGTLTGANARGLEWGNSPERQRWTDSALASFREHWAKLQQAQDVNSFCPGYARSSRAEQENCWLLILNVLVRRESGFNARNVSSEGPPLNYHSVGLLQLSHNGRARECVQEGARSEEDLKNAELNLRCGIRTMANLISKHGRIAGRRGAGSYWSPLRNPGEHRYAASHQVIREASARFVTQVAGRFPAQPQTGGAVQTAMQ